jgi:hypothetical protein
MFQWRASLTTIIAAGVAGITVVACSGAPNSSEGTSSFENVTVDQSEIRSGAVRIVDGSGDGVTPNAAPHGGLEVQSFTAADANHICCSGCTCPGDGTPCSCQKCAPCPGLGLPE